MPLLLCSQPSFLLSAACHGVDVGVVDGLLQRIEYLLLAREERAAEVERRSVVGVQLAVAVEQRQEGVQLLHQLALVEGRKLATLCFLQEWSAGVKE